MKCFALLLGVVLCAASQDMNNIDQARNRADLEVRRKQSLEALLATHPTPNEEFVDKLGRLDWAVEGREDLTWSLEVYEHGLHYLDERQASVLVKAKLLERFAGALGAREQYVRQIEVLEKALSLLPKQEPDLATARAGILKALSGAFDETGDVGAASRALEEAASLDQARPTDRTHTLSSLAEHYAKHGDMTKAQDALARLQTYLKQTPAPPTEAQKDGWQRLAMFYSGYGFPQEAVAAELELARLAKQQPFREILSHLSGAYQAAKDLDAEARQNVATLVLSQAEAAAGAPGRIDLLLELASDDVVQARQEDARVRLDQARAAITTFGEQASREQKIAWRVRSDDVTGSLARVARGETVYSTSPILRALDKNGDPISSPEPPPLAPSEALRLALKKQMTEQAPKTEAEALELMKRLAAQTAGADADAALKDMLSSLQALGDANKPATADEMKRLDANDPHHEMAGEDWQIVQRAIQAGQGACAERFLIRRIQQEADAFAHPFDIQEMMGTLLDAFAQRQAWDDGRHWLGWWRELIARIDHPESTRLLINFEAEAKWEERAAQLAKAAQIQQNELKFARKIMGAGNAEVLRLEGKFK